MADLPRRDWREMTTAEIAGADTARWIAVLPVVAIARYGPGLPLSADAIINAGILDRALELLPAGLPVTVLPALAGLPALEAGGAGDGPDPPGTLTLTAETLGRMGKAIGLSVHGAGVRKLVLFDGHDGEAGTTDGIARELRERFAMRAVTASWRRFGLPADPAPAGGAVETAMMRALRPDLVQANGATDADADAERGRRLVDHAAACLAGLLDEVDSMTADGPQPGTAV